MSAQPGSKSGLCGSTESPGDVLPCAGKVQEYKGTTAGMLTVLLKMRVPVPGCEVLGEEAVSVQHKQDCRPSFPVGWPGVS